MKSTPCLLALLAFAPGCASVMTGNTVQFAEEPSTIAYCEERGEVEASVRKQEAGPNPFGPGLSDKHAALDALIGEAYERGADTVYRVTTEEDDTHVTARGTAYFCDRANQPNDYE